MRVLFLLCGLSLLVAILNMPMGYYTFLRILISIGAVVIVINNKQRNLIRTVFLIVLIVFNPIIPVYLYDKDIWKPIDITTGILFIYQYYNFKSTINEK